MRLLSKTSIFLSLGCTIILASCSNESPWGSQTVGEGGKIELNLLTDSSVTLGTRADEDNYAMSPDAADFSVALVSRDGSIDREWDSLKKFNAEEAFPMGYYTLSVFYGNPDIEGFENPYYYAEEDIEVELGETTVKTLTAQLANSMLSVKYSSDFTSMFKAYSSAIQTEGNDKLLFGQNEARPAYVKSDNASFFVTMTNDKDETVTVELMKLAMKPRHHYIVTVGVNMDNLGTPTLKVEVTEDIIVEEPLEIVLSEEFFTAPVPVITALGFENGKSIDFFEAFTDDLGNPRIEVMALAGLQSAVLHLKANDEASLPVWNSNAEDIELMKAASDIQNQLTSAKLNCVGFFNNTADFGYVDFSEFIKSLNPGSYTASLSVKDKLGRTVDANLPEIVLKTNVEEVKYEISGYKNPDFLSDKVYIGITTNCSLIKENFKFYSNEENGDIARITINDVNILDSDPGLTSTSVTPYDNTYYYEIITDKINDNVWTVGVQYAEKDQKNLFLDVNMPQFTVDTDAFAKRVKIKIDAGDASLTEALAKLIFVRNGDKSILPENIDRTYASQGLIIVKGLNSLDETVNGQVFDGNYNLTLFLGNTLRRAVDGYSGIPYKGTPCQFITERALDVPNGDFEQLTEKYSSKKINQSGPWATSGASLARNQNTATITLSEASGWSTTNDKTMSGSNENTWFTVPSVFNSGIVYDAYCTGAIGIGTGTKTPASYDGFTGISGNAMVIRNVGWDPAGITPDRCTRTPKASQSDYYNHTVPSVSQKSIGKMFLGDYKYENGKETIKEGVSFASRPLRLIGNYIFQLDKTSQIEETGKVYIKIRKGEIVLAEGETDLTKSDNYSEFEINLNYSSFGEKADNLCIMIQSSNITDESQIPISEYLSTFECFKHGATLVVDNFHFKYE